PSSSALDSGALRSYTTDSVSEQRPLGFRYDSSGVPQQSTAYLSAYVRPHPSQVFDCGNSAESSQQSRTCSSSFRQIGQPPKVDDLSCEVSRSTRARMPDKDRRITAPFSLFPAFTFTHHCLRAVSCSRWDAS